MDHARYIHRCLELAEHGRGLVGNGAMVGAVLVRNGSIIAEGWHAGFGYDHAEASLIKNFVPTSPSGLRGAGQKIQQEDVLYCNLEPCCHQGKMPPCTEKIIASGIKHVVFGMVDPDQRVAGKGIRILRDAGIEVIGPVLPEVCRRFNKGFVSVREQGRPYVTLKYAQTLSGAIANPDGSKKKITSDVQDVWSHTWLRAKHDAILVGSGTVLSDDPELTVRHYMNKKSIQEIPQPYKIILDKHCETPITSKVVSLNPERTIIVMDAATKLSHPRPPAGEAGRGALEKLGVQVFTIPLVDGIFDWTSLLQSLTGNSAPHSSQLKACLPDRQAHSFHGITSILVEGGPKIWKTFRDAGMVDEEVTLMGD